MNALVQMMLGLQNSLIVWYFYIELEVYLNEYDFT